MQTVARTPTFLKQAEAILTEDELNAVVDMLASNPLCGDEIQGTGGVRKVRVPARGKGKSGGARVIYYWYSENYPIYALLAYGKGRQTNLTPRETKAVAAFAKVIKAMAREK